MQNCQGKTKTGDACRAPAMSGGLCFFHANPDRAKTLGQIGGQKNRKFEGVDLHVPESMSATDLRKLMTGAIRSLLSGELQAREAIALNQLCNSLYRYITTVELEMRITRLEEQRSPQELEIGTELKYDSTVSEPAQTETATAVDVRQVTDELCPSDTNWSDQIEHDVSSARRGDESDQDTKL